MARQLLKDDGSYDRAAIVRRANHGLRLARRIGLEWDRAHCLAYVWDRRGRLRAEFLGRSLAPVRRKAARLKTPLRRKSLTKAESARGSRIEN
ncbi:MAG: hypothetical protein WBO09_17910 [Methylocystis silviterrae]|uniref:hypothetical protein n=1 Tax=Methylocystis silviterrae TaxID=2743612 RepID=UPI003C74CB73